MNNELILLSKNDIPFVEAQVNIHQPTIREISLISEESFQIGIRFLNFSIDSLPNEDKVSLMNKSDFEVFMSIMNSDEKAQYKVSALLVLALLFPEHTIKFTEQEIILAGPNGLARINKDNYGVFKDIIATMFCLNEDSAGQGEDYNPADAFAAKIADKLKKGRANKGTQKDISKVSIYSRYVSILAVGLQKDMNSLVNYTVYQLKDEFKRFQLKQDFDIYLEAKLAGAKDLEEVDNWMDDIHP